MGDAQKSGADLLRRREWAVFGTELDDVEWWRAGRRGAGFPISQVPTFPVLSSRVYWRGAARFPVTRLPMSDKAGSNTGTST